jgi:excisionase family DNA binding protein
MVYPMGLLCRCKFINMDLVEKFAELQQEIRALKDFVAIRQDEYLTLAEAAKFLKVSLSTMEKVSASRMIPVYKPSGGKVYFKRQDLISYVNEGRLRSRKEIEEAALKKMEV